MLATFRKQLLFDLIAVLGSFLVFGLALFFVGRDLRVKAESVSESRIRAEEDRSVAQAIAGFRSVLPEAEAYEQKINLLLPERDQILYLSEWLEGLAQPHGVDVTFALKEEGSQGNTKFVSFSFSLRGRYESVLALLRQVEANNTRFLIGLGNFSVKHLGGNDYQVSFDARAFYK